jgi:hypothetical protein
LIYAYKENEEKYRNVLEELAILHREFGSSIEVECGMSKEYIKKGVSPQILGIEVMDQKEEGKEEFITNKNKQTLDYILVPLKCH